MKTKPQLKIGLLNDLHYDGGVDALNRLYESVTALNRGGAEVLLVLGDLVDATSETNAMRLLREVSALCDLFHSSVYYMPGNHDLDHLSKEQFYGALGRPDDSSRFHFEQGGYEFMGIDGNFSPNGTEYDRGNFKWQEAFIPSEQLNELRVRLAAASLPVLIFTHQRLDQSCLHAVKNDVDVRDMIHLSGKVVAVFQGHQHADDFKQIDETAYYTLGAHKEGAGPALVHLDPEGIRLVRDFQALKSDSLA